MGFNSGFKELTNILYHLHGTLRSCLGLFRASFTKRMKYKETSSNVNIVQQISGYITTDIKSNIARHSYRVSHPLGSGSLYDATSLAQCITWSMCARLWRSLSNTSIPSRLITRSTVIKHLKPSACFIYTTWFNIQKLLCMWLAYFLKKEYDYNSQQY